MQNRLQEIRWSKGISQKQLELKSGVRRSTIAELERNRIKNPSLDIAMRLANALNVDVQDIFFDKSWKKHPVHNHVKGDKHMTDYKNAIIHLLQKINDPKKLKIIFHLVCHLYSENC